MIPFYITITIMSTFLCRCVCILKFNASWHLSFSPPQILFFIRGSSFFKNDKNYYTPIYFPSIWFIITIMDSYIGFISINLQSESKHGGEERKKYHICHAVRSYGTINFCYWISTSTTRFDWTHIRVSRVFSFLKTHFHVTHKSWSFEIHIHIH